MVKKLKARLDKTESDLVQRLKFNIRVQQPDESLEDFVLSVKLQAEFCNFETFKDMAIRDRIVAGIRDKVLQQRLLNEEKLTLGSEEKMIATWEIARNNAKNMDCANTSCFEHISSLKAEGGSSGARFKKLAATLDLANKWNHGNGGVERSRGPVKSRLGYSPYQREQWRNRQWQGKADQARRGLNRGQHSEERNRSWNRPDYSQMVCEFCGVKGHIKKKCFKLKNMQRDAVNMVQDNQSGKNRDEYLSDLVNRLHAASDSEEEEEEADGSNWKRSNPGPSSAASFD
nr:uncharacterized protein LOC109430395 [Aedes albopictus]